VSSSSSNFNHHVKNVTSPGAGAKGNVREFERGVSFI